MSAVCVSYSDLIAVLICFITPSVSVLALLAIGAIENFTVRALRSFSGRSDAVLLQKKVKAALELSLQLLTTIILLKMVQLLGEEVLEIANGAMESDNTLQLVFLLVGGVAALAFVWVMEGSEHGEPHGSSRQIDHPSEPSTKSARGVVFAMLLHTCAEGLAAGLVLSPSDKSDREGPMFDMASAFFVSFALHNVADGLVVSTAVRKEIKSGSWISSAVVNTTFSHIGQPLGLLAILFADQLGLAALTGQTLFVAFIQGVSLGSLVGAVALESLPEVWGAARELFAAFGGSKSNKLD
eukprot:GDKK01001508.1.p1 GENE.GDKK01001508.1~~GDKK01001508.1.p1  ORF type:complete len:297 (-),score=32.55 GDKK01001508.1:94-984(-)